MKFRRVSDLTFLILQIPVVAAFAFSYASLDSESQRQIRRLTVAKQQIVDIEIRSDKSLVISQLHDDPQLVSDEELAAVLKQIAPRFPAKKTKPNHVEHALRTWHVDAKFQDPAIRSGVWMRDFLLDHARFLASWEEDTPPLLQERPADGIYIRWGREESSASVHHDHMLACLTEGGVTLSQPVFTPNRRDLVFGDVLRQALRDFRYDERETEWSAMAFGLWVAPTAKSWRLVDGREMSFDMLAKRMLRGHKQMGTCGGTHRLYSMMVLLRLDEEYDILSDDVQASLFKHLEGVRDLLKVGQFEDGHWSYQWPNGEDAVKKPDPSIAMYRHVIATGHHLEWLAIAPESLHPPREQIRHAAAWIIQKTIEMKESEILENYTFFTHVGNALCLWRKTNPSKFYMEWEKTHPFVPKVEEKKTDEKADADKPTSQPEAKSGDTTESKATEKSPPVKSNPATKK